MIRVRLRAVAVAASSALLVLTVGAGVGGAQTRRSVKTLRLTSKLQHLATIDLGRSGPSIGDLHVFTSTLSRNGRRVGTLRGYYMTVRIHGRQQFAAGQETFDLRAGNQLVVAISNVHPVPDNGVVPNKSFPQAVIGGTGTYAGARGTMTTLRRGPGRYEDDFRLPG